MSNHLKRLASPDSWQLKKKTHTFVTKTAPGPHTGEAMPMAIWLTEHMGLARNRKEVKQILHQRDIIVNGKPCRDLRMGVGVFDIISIPKIGKHYRLQLDKKGRLISIEIPEEAAGIRLCKIRDKTVVSGGRVQLNLLYGANILADNTYRPRDSIVVTLGTGEDRFRIVDHFPFEEGNMAMVIGGKHSGKIGKIVEIVKTPSSQPNRVTLEDAAFGTGFETIDDYVFVIGRRTPSGEIIWGIEA
ncbi:ssu ribosomal protein s4e [hydrocarbon metagenome]|uniref:Ssu ribosomal protein s4e n=1 Tax=hydrocarbon metagenome TaxID=938273 RepID=A0A0W8FHM3_9ZZZZ|nr:30S ribosomal protein S4e [Methanomicrobiaceae archaeon]